jgi:hypothetical protein
MKETHRDWRYQKPVCLGGMPLQVPMPIAASGRGPKLGNGHIDVLARLGRGGKGLRVYEVKAPGVRAESALDQAACYLAALDFVLWAQPDGEARKAWWRFIGFSGTPTRPPRLEVCAVVEDSKANRMLLDEAKKRLASANGLVASAVVYSGGRTDAPRFRQA